ncbi:MAG: response regulator [Candidatus Methanoperedens sp.]|nr:response regulator [Candidatus Methanoperedens sp.]MCZ7358968.1 response regulator [Candidatus Methanoperedens sp.]HLB70070.1 response regulator [Candidatus Methanoperedens sp.]
MNKSKILVVDDEQLNVELFEGILSKEYDIVTALSGIDALVKVEKTVPDLILLDIMMPNMNGYAVCKQLKGNPRTMHIPIVMVTALKEREDKIKAIEAGADDFLSKPIDMYELNARVKSLLRIKQYYDSMTEERENLLIFRSALNSMDDCVIITNMSGDIKYVNPAFEKKYGYSQAETGGMHISRIRHSESSLSLDKDSLMQDVKHEWKGNLISVSKHGLRINMGVKCSPVIKDNRHINLVFVLREQN